MRIFIAMAISSSLLFLSPLLAQEHTKPEVQISFARENKPHQYYVQQAELWWKELEKNKRSETSWYNYYRACRNAQGTANWRTDFVKESPYLRLGDEIVKLMEADIPGTFTYNFVRGSTGAVAPEEGEYLIRAYKMKPEFEGLLEHVVTYATSTLNPGLRKEANQKWYLLNGIPNDLMAFGYNLLNSVEPNSILLTEHDNDTYPAWMLQDVKQTRTDVMVLNIDFLLYGDYREKIFRQLGIKPFQLGQVDINEYEKNWENVIKHFLVNYKGKRPLYVSKTVSTKWYQGFENSLYTSGLAMKYSGTRIDFTKKNISLVEDIFLLETLNVQLTYNVNNQRLYEMNTGYLDSFKIIYNAHKRAKDHKRANKIRELAFAIINRIDNPELEKKHKSLFN